MRQVGSPLDYQPYRGNSLPTGWLAASGKSKRTGVRLLSWNWIKTSAFIGAGISNAKLGRQGGMDNRNSLVWYKKNTYLFDIKFKKMHNLYPGNPSPPKTQPI